jgi:hypothetical protein
MSHWGARCGRHLVKICTSSGRYRHFDSVRQHSQPWTPRTRFILESMHAYIQNFGARDAGTHLKGITAGRNPPPAEVSRHNLLAGCTTMAFCFLTITRLIFAHEAWMSSIKVITLHWKFLKPITENHLKTFLCQVHFTFGRRWCANFKAATYN